MKFITKKIIAGITFLILASGSFSYNGCSRIELPVYGTVTEFNLSERSGKSITIKELEAKISVINFFFANCTGPCPAMNAKVAELYRNFASVPKVQFISISIDPERDSLEALRKYAETFSVSDNRWLFLRTSSDKVHHLAEKVFMVGGESPSIHSTKLILVDAQAQIRGFYSSEEKESLSTLKTHIGELLRK